MNDIQALSMLAETVPGASRLERRTQIAWFEQALKQIVEALGLPQTELPLRHMFTTGAYVREITLPAGQIIVGKLHRHAHLNFISRGSVTVVTEHGGVERLTGPCTIISPAGTKRVVYTHEETVWTTVHVTEETDLKKIEAETIAPSYTALGLEEPQSGGVLCLGQ